MNVFCDGKPTSVCNHTLVLTAFLGPRPEGMECCHGLGGRADASLANIRWDTKLANEADKEISGTRYRGSKCHAAKLDEDAVAEIRKRHAAGGVTLVELAAEFGVTDTVIGDAIRRVTWSHVA